MIDSRDIGITIPVNDFKSGFDFLDGFAGDILRLFDDGPEPVRLEHEEKREGLTEDRGQTWLQGDHTKNYRKGAFEYRVSYSWAEDPFREDLSFQVLRHHGDEVVFLVSAYRRNGGVSLPEGPGNFNLSYESIVSEKKIRLIVEIFSREQPSHPSGQPR